MFLNNCINFQGSFPNIMADQVLAVITNEDGGQLKSGLHFLSSYCFLLSWVVLYPVFPSILLISEVS